MRDYGKNSTAPAKGMADGGSVGFWERLKAGNIDDPRSEAYRRWGEGSHSRANGPEYEPAATPAPAPAAPVATSSPVSDNRDRVPAIQDAAPDESDAETARLKRQDATPAPKKTPLSARLKAAAKAVTGAGAGRGGQGGAGFGEGVVSGVKAVAPTKPTMVDMAAPAPRKIIDINAIDPNTLLPRRGAGTVGSFADGGLIGSTNFSSRPGGAKHYGKK